MKKEVDNTMKSKKLPTQNSDESKKCMCGSSEFNQFSKYSHVLEKKVEYYQCELCGQIVADGIKNYDLSKIYNEDYFMNVDIGWKNRSKLIVKFVNIINYSLNFKKMSICDYGAGNGYLAKSLIDIGYNVLAYEPYLGRELYLNKKYFIDTPFPADALIMIEVFEHFIDPLQEINAILKKFSGPQILLFSTLLVENAKYNINDWWYLNPDAGHFTLWSKKSLKDLSNLTGYKFISFADFFHVFIAEELYKEYIILKLQSIIYNMYISLKKRIIKG